MCHKLFQYLFDEKALEEGIHFKYLGSRINNYNTLISEVLARIASLATIFAKFKIGMEFA